MSRHRRRNPVRVLAIPGSLRRASHTTALLHAAAKYAPDGVEITLYDGLVDVPPYNQDVDTDVGPGAVVRLREAIARADAVLFSTPEYNTSIPGQLKNALDWASRPYPANALRDKPVAAIGASEGRLGAMRAQAELRTVLKTIGARVVECELAVAVAHRALDSDGRPRDETTRARLTQILRALAEQAHRGSSERAA